MSPSIRPNRNQARAYGYLRVSTDAQAESGLELDGQRTAVEGSATRLGLPLVDVFADEGVSGATDLDGRPSL